MYSGRKTENLTALFPSIYLNDLIAKLANYPNHHSVGGELQVRAENVKYILVFLNDTLRKIYLKI